MRPPITTASSGQTSSVSRPGTSSARGFHLRGAVLSGCAGRKCPTHNATAQALNQCPVHGRGQAALFFSLLESLLDPSSHRGFWRPGPCGICLASHTPTGNPIQNVPRLNSVPTIYPTVTGGLPPPVSAFSSRPALPRSHNILVDRVRIELTVTKVQTSSEPQLTALNRAGLSRLSLVFIRRLTVWRPALIHPFSLLARRGPVFHQLRKVRNPVVQPVRVFVSSHLFGMCAPMLAGELFFSPVNLGSNNTTRLLKCNTSSLRFRVI